jgi:murein DD-endopeptidase / murein LD-carboxypeptidase
MSHKNMHGVLIISSRSVLFLFFSALLLLASCSRQLFPTQSTGDLRRIKDAEFQSFLAGGAQKRLDTGLKKPKHIIKTAEKYMGTPHCMGGITPKCLDCSGLTWLAFGAHKIELPRRSQDQARFGRIIPDKSQLRRGDLVFFTRSYSTSDYVTHVGICLGDNSFIHASTSRGVIVTDLNDPWWSQRFVFGTRVF